MNKILEKKWAKTILPFSSVLYMLFLVSLAYNTFMYEFVIGNKIIFGILYVLFNAGMFALMYLSRKNRMSSIISLFYLLVTFSIVLFAFGNYLIIIPIFLVSVATLFTSKGSETKKTVIGTAYLLLYVLGIVVFILINSFFGDKIGGRELTKSSIKTGELSKFYTEKQLSPLLENTVSPDKKFRYYIVDIDNRLNGEIQIVVVPNNHDKNFGLFSLREKGRTKIVAFSKSRGDKVLPTVKWVGNNKIEYKFPDWAKEKHSVIKNEDCEKDYFSFLYR